VTAVWVALLGAAGSLARWGLSNAISRRAPEAGFPWGTFAVNMIGSAAIGVVMGVFLLRGEGDSRARMALTAGFLGGFTTYSAFAWDTWALVERRAWGTAVAYVTATTLASVAACAMAALLVTRLRG
jgi:CrcB protein